MLLWFALLTALDYRIGPGQPLATIGEVPWATLQPGDQVFIHYRPEPYREKWVICRQGTADAPIRVTGVPGPEGELPVIDGNNAATAPGLNYWSEQRGVIKVGGANIPADTMPRHVVIENLDIREARRPNAFTDDSGNRQTYSANAAAIFVEKGEFITIRHCRLHASGNGLFVASADNAVSRDILITSNWIWDNGNPGSLFEHNSYTAAIGITYEHNRFGPLRTGANGNNLKDRSAGLVVRANWIAGGNRQLDLVEGDDTSAITRDAAYRETLVEGNVLIENAGDGNRQIVHYGGDNGNAELYRKGILLFRYNTIVSRRTDRTTFFRLSTNDERCDARHNLFYTTEAGTTASWLDTEGTLALTGNWTKSGIRGSFSDLRGSVQEIDTVVTEDPGFAAEADEDFRLTPGAPAVLPGERTPPERQYLRHQASEPRRADDALGAFAKIE
jgi:hypothetical protein